MGIRFAETLGQSVGAGKGDRDRMTSKEAYDDSPYWKALEKRKKKAKADKKKTKETKEIK